MRPVKENREKKVRSGEKTKLFYALEKGVRVKVGGGDLLMAFLCFFFVNKRGGGSGGDDGNVITIVEAKAGFNSETKM